MAGENGIDGNSTSRGGRRNINVINGKRRVGAETIVIIYPAETDFNIRILLALAGSIKSKPSIIPAESRKRYWLRALKKMLCSMSSHYNNTM
jgi:hypothetical protein